MSRLPQTDPGAQDTETVLLWHDPDQITPEVSPGFPDMLFDNILQNNHCAQK